MKKRQLVSWALLSVLIFLGSFQSVRSDAIVMSNNRVITGNIIQTNDSDILILTRHGAFNFSQASIKGVIPEMAQAADTSKASRLQDFQATILLLSKQPWATNMSPIPATVIDKGILRNVPYASLRCGQDFEVNVYGDLEKPAGIEIGIYRDLLRDESVKNNCIDFIRGLLHQTSDQEALLSLDRTKGIKTCDEYTFEITPPTDADSYNGWWVSVYSVKQLNLARASDAAMQLISMTQADAEADAKKSTNIPSWNANDFKKARPATTITFRNPSGMWITNAEVVRVIDGVSLIWKNGPTSGGLVKLADLPVDLQEQFGYDEAKTIAADNLARQQKARLNAEISAAAVAQSSAPQSDFSSGYNFGGYSGNYSAGSRVYVHGYYRANGTYVNAYTRSAPHRRR